MATVRPMIGISSSTKEYIHTYILEFNLLNVLPEICLVNNVLHEGLYIFEEFDLVGRGPTYVAIRFGFQLQFNRLSNNSDDFRTNHII